MSVQCQSMIIYSILCEGKLGQLPLMVKAVVCMPNIVIFYTGFNAEKFEVIRVSIVLIHVKD